MNALPRCDGKFLHVSISLASNLNHHVFTNLTLDWKELVQIFKNMVTRKKNGFRDKRENKYSFGNERVLVGSQVYCSFYLRKKNTIFFSICSFRRLNDLLTYGGLSAVAFELCRKNQEIKYDERW